MAYEEAGLLTRLRAGERSAFETLYRQHVDRVWRYAWFRTHAREAAAEIVQETFLRVARSIGKFKGRSSLATWIFTLTRAAAVDYLRLQRKARRVVTEPANLRLIAIAEPPNPGVDEATRAVVRQAVAELPAARRDALVLCELLEMNIREAAEVLGWSESRVKVTLFRARRHLREVLTNRLELTERKSEQKGITNC